MTAPDSRTPSFERTAREAETLLTEVVAVLEAAGEARAGAEIADAVAALREAARSEANAQTAYLRLRTAIGHLGRGLSALEADPSDRVAEASESVARALALLYPVARAHQRQRRQVVFHPSLPPSGELASLPPAPETAGPAGAGGVRGGPERRRGTRIRVEADVGLLSESHFYTGLSRDVSRGGLFVATYQPKPPGTEVALYFVLPSGRTVHADGVVAWTSEAVGDLAPGMGIAFQRVADDDLEAIEEFCRERTPTYHDSADD